VIARLRAHDHPFAHRHLCCEAAGHLLGVPGTMYGPHAPSFPMVMGGSRDADDHASQEIWPAVLDFLSTATR
jgi:hypothetical protein